jgi:hypothetical protein
MLSQVTSGSFSLERRPSAFLSLAPTTSASYPSTPKSPTQVQEPAPLGPQTSQGEAAPPTVAKATEVPRTEDVAELLKKSRSSSSGSDGSSKRGYLKLGPVHFGEGGGDWSEDVLSV